MLHCDKGSEKMIYYFSGTGNSEWAARTLAHLTHDSVTRITKKTLLPVKIEEGEVFGLVFPIYAWNLPEMVSEFLKNVSVHTLAYCYAVCTCGAEAGYAMKLLNARVRMSGVWSLIMPDNYIVAYSVEDDATALEKVREANVRLQQIAAHINARDKGCADVQVGKLAFVKTFVGGHLFNKYARSSKPFRSSYDCTGCGLCAKVCPTQNILVADNMPFWSDDCQQCLACIHRCPKQAIEYGRSTEKHGRYVFHFTEDQIDGEE